MRFCRERSGASANAGVNGMRKDRPTNLVIGLELMGLLAAAAAAVWQAPNGNWDIPLMAVLFAVTTISDLTAFPMPSRIKVSAATVSLIVAMVILGGTPAAVIGAGTILVGWLRWREASHFFLNNLLTYVTFPLASGIAFRALSESLQVT